MGHVVESVDEDLAEQAREIDRVEVTYLKPEQAHVAAAIRQPQALEAHVGAPDLPVARAWSWRLVRDVLAVQEQLQHFTGGNPSELRTPGSRPTRLDSVS